MSRTRLPDTQYKERRTDSEEEQYKERRTLTMRNSNKKSELYQRSTVQKYIINKKNENKIIVKQK